MRLSNQRAIFRGITRELLLGLTACGLAVAQTTPGCQAGSPDYVIASLSHIAAELRQRHLEILEDRQDILQAKMKDLGQEIQTAQSRQQREQRTITQELADIEAHLAQSNPDRAEREELENRRAELLAKSGRPGNAESTLAQRETQARERLVILQQRLQLLAQRARELSPGRQSAPDISQSRLLPAKRIQDLVHPAGTPPALPARRVTRIRP